MKKLFFVLIVMLGFVCLVGYDKKSVYRVTETLNVGTAYDVYDLFVSRDKNVYMKMDEYWLVPDKTGPLSIRLTVTENNRKREEYYEFVVADNEAPKISQIEALIPQGHEYNIFDYIDISDNVNDIDELEYQIDGFIDIYQPGDYHLDLYVTDRYDNTSKETLYFEVIAYNDPMYELCKSYIKNNK